MQNALTVIVKIKPGETKALDGFLSAIGSDIKNNPYMRFDALSTTHFARWVIFDQDRPQQQLLFTSNHDGDWAPYIDSLVDQIGSAVDAIWSKCEGYPGGYAANRAGFKTAFRDYIQAHSYPSGVFFLAYPNRTVKEVGSYRRLREAFQKALNAPAAEPLLGTLAELPVVPEKPQRGIGAFFQAILALPIKLLLGSVAPFILRLISAGAPRLDRDHPSETVNVPLSLTERSIVQNELTIIADINPARLLRLRLILRVVQLLVVRFGNGTLSNIATIHFARWVIFDGGKRVLFESNYDGTWEQYIGDFIDQAWRGLDLIFGNCAGYPKEGARDSQRFKYAIMSHQYRAQIFYSAYPNDSVRNIRNNIALSDGVRQLLGKKDIADLLRRL